MSIVIRWSSILATVLLITACSAPEKDRWDRPGQSTGPKPSDLASCRYDANHRAEQEFALDTIPRNDRGFGSSSGLQADLARRDAIRYRQRIYDECMRGLGYQKAPRR